ncbi:MAG: hypothetical protein ACRDSS_10250 [Actinocrinis sp.]
MSEATTTEPTEAAASERKEASTLMKVASIGMSALGSSAAGHTFVGNTMDHADHGHSVARWVGTALSFAGFLVGGVVFPFSMTVGSVICGVLQLAAVISVPVLNAAGYGRPDVWGQLKAEAAAQRAGA